MVWYKSIHKKLRTAGQLRLQEWLWLAEAWILLLHYRLVLLIIPFSKWRSSLIKSTKQNSQKPSFDEQYLCQKLAWLVSIASRYHLGPMRCLPRSLTLQKMLAKRNVQARLCIGIKLENNNLDGHAWLQMGDQVINDTVQSTEQYVTLRRLPDY